MYIPICMYMYMYLYINIYSYVCRPEATLQSWNTLHDIYPDAPRKGGADAALLYDNDPNAERLFDLEEVYIDKYIHACIHVCV